MKYYSESDKFYVFSHSILPGFARFCNLHAVATFAFTQSVSVHVWGWVATNMLPTILFLKRCSITLPSDPTTKDIDERVTVARHAFLTQLWAVVSASCPTRQTARAQTFTPELLMEPIRVSCSFFLHKLFLWRCIGMDFLTVSASTFASHFTSTRLLTSQPALTPSGSKSTLT